jgi:hypothetical protein
MTRKSLPKYALAMEAKWKERSAEVLRTRLRALDHEHRLNITEARTINMLLSERKNTPEKKAIEERLEELTTANVVKARQGYVERARRWLGWGA